MEKNIAFVIVLVFSLSAILAQIYTVHTVMKSQLSVKDRVYDFPMIRVSVLYLFIQLLASVLTVGFCAKIPVFAAIIIEIVILVIAVMAFYAVKVTQNEILRQDAQLKKELSKMEELQTRINLLISQCEEKQIRDMIQSLSEEVRYSNPISRDISEEIEEELEVLFTDIETRVLDGDVENTTELCSRMKGLLRERDRICKYGR